MVSTPKMPDVKYPDPLPPPPERSDEATANLAEEQRRFRKGTGRASTMLSGADGAGPASSAVRFLGGASRT